MLKRTLLYLRRKKGKTFTLFALLFLIATFVTTSFALMYTMNEVSTLMRTTLGGQIEVRQEHWLGDLQVADSGESPGAVLTETNLTQMLEIQGARSHVARTSGHVRSLSFIEGFDLGELDDMGGIHGVNDSELLSDFSDETLSLAEGRHITPEDENKVIISLTLALENDLEVGDQIELTSAEFGSTDIESGTSVQAEIVGIFTETEVQPIGFRPTASLMANQLFSDHSLLYQLGLANLGEYESVTLYVYDPADLPRIVAEIRQLDGVDWDSFNIQYNDFNYMRISGDLQTVQNLILVLLVGIGVISTVILALILVLRMRGRVREVGILLSVGISKNQIWSGFLLEITMISVVAFILSYITSTLLVPFLNQGLLADLPMMNELGQADFQSMPLAVYFIVFMLILFVVLLTAFISTLLTIRLKPKQILSKLS